MDGHKRTKTWKDMAVGKDYSLIFCGVIKHVLGAGTVWLEGPSADTFRAENFCITASEMGEIVVFFRFACGTMKRLWLSLSLVHEPNSITVQFYMVCKTPVHFVLICAH